MRRATLVIFLLSFSAFVNAQVFSNYDGHVKFNNFMTYAWIAPGDSVLNRHRADKVFGGFIMHVANQELKRRGLAIDTIRPSALFIFHTQVQEKILYTQGSSLSVGVGVYGHGYYAGGVAPVAGGEIAESLYQKGALVFEMVDTKTGHVIWTAGDKKDINNSDDIQKIITTSVKKIFKKFPVKSR